MIQWQFDWWFSLGFHLDLRQRWSAIHQIHYGPYLDLHLGFFIISIGYHPVYSGELDASVSGGRGGIRADD